MYKVLVTGSQGFIGSYICNELLSHGYEVIGVDNYQKYGELARPHDSHPKFKLYNLNILHSDFQSLVDSIAPDFIVAGAAMIGGISYFHKYAYDLMATNERILASTFDAAIRNMNNGLKRIIVLSSSMVFENTELYPTPETEVNIAPPPSSTYGFQKLASEYFAKGAWEQYKLPYTIVRPFNCVGVGEEKALGEFEVTSGNIQLMLSHVLPDLINKIKSGQDPVHILGSGDQIRCYTNGRDIGRGIRYVIENENATNEDFNISIATPTSVLELAELVWNKINPEKEFRYVSDDPFEYDVQKRVPDVTKAKNLLGFEAEIGLYESIDEVMEYLNEHR
jgi:nucleoside-diphosphate-sugar epimerase